MAPSGSGRGVHRGEFLFVDAADLTRPAMPDFLAARLCRVRRVYVASASRVKLADDSSRPYGGPKSRTYALAARNDRSPPALCTGQAAQNHCSNAGAGSPRDAEPCAGEEEAPASVTETDAAP